MLTTTQAAARLGISPSHLVRLCNRGEIACTLMAGGSAHRRIAEADLEAYAAAWSGQLRVAVIGGFPEICAKLRELNCAVRDTLCFFEAGLFRPDIVLVEAGLEHEVSGPAVISIGTQVGRDGSGLAVALGAARERMHERKF